ncbi:MAG: hypothetical protein QXU81_00095 [Candidatus Bathyarchaeia archaeon]
MEKNIVLPRWVLFCLVTAVVASFVFATTTALTSVFVRKPLVVNVIAQEPTLSLNSAVFTYNSTKNIYTDCTLTITNTAGGGITAKIAITLYDATQTKIAYGEKTVSIASSSANVNVSLDWLPGKSITNLSSGIIAIEQL